MASPREQTDKQDRAPGWKGHRLEGNSPVPGTVVTVDPKVHRYNIPIAPRLGVSPAVMAKNNFASNAGSHAHCI